MIRRIVFGIAAFPLCAFSLSAQTAAPHATLPAGLPLRVAIDHRYPIRIGTRVQGHLTTAVYLVDHIVLPVDTPVYGVIVGRHPVKKSVRINALLDGDFTRLSVPEIRFETMQLPDGSETAFTAAAIERDSVIVRMNRNKPDNSVSGILKAEYTARRREIMGGYVSPGKSASGSTTCCPTILRTFGQASSLTLNSANPLRLRRPTIPRPLCRLKISNLISPLAPLKRASRKT